jgi:hypothetical protein
MAQREGFVELVRGHPAVLFDDAAAGEWKNTAIAGKRHPREGKQQRDYARWRFGRKFRRGNRDRRGIQGHKTSRMPLWAWPSQFAVFSRR